MKVAYQHLVNNIKENPDISELSERLFQLGHEHEINGNIFEFELTPNRGDCLSIKGLCRDLNVFYNINVEKEIYNGEISEYEFQFDNHAKTYCPTISFLKIEIDKIPKKYNPELDNFFKIFNIKKNNFFTDVSNYISYETGQPTHAYHASSIGQYIKLDLIDNEVEFETLFDEKISLSGPNLVFLNKTGEIINLAGVIGGSNTSCNSETKSVIIECAYFDPEIILGKSLTYSLNSEAAYKFERGVDPLSHEYVLRRFLKIIEDHTNIVKAELFCEKPDLIKEQRISFDEVKINKILGINLSKEKQIEYLDSLGFKTSDNEIIVPSYRSDVSCLNDISEEIARAVGYDNIPSQCFNIVSARSMSDVSITNNIKDIKNLLINNGFYEVINNPFVSEHDKYSYEVDNPLDSNKKYLRTTLKNSLLENLLYNERRQKDSIKLFEVSNLYSLKDNSVIKSIGIIASGRVDKNYEDFSKKITLEYISKLLNNHIVYPQSLNFENISRESLNSKSRNPIIYTEIELNSSFHINYENKSKIKNIEEYKYKPISEFPCSQRDISFAVKDNSKIKLLEEYILCYKHDLIKDVYVFDYYMNEKTKETKIGFRFIFQLSDATITDIQVNNIMNVIIEEAIIKFNVKIPGIN
jgi:phenylalanyl-tRNA synthetase beta chain